MMRRTALAVAALLLAARPVLATGAYVTRTVQDGSGTHIQSYYDESGVGTGPFDPVSQMPSGFAGGSSSGGPAYGPDAVGNAPTKPPVLVGLLDSSGNVRQASPTNPLPIRLYPSEEPAFGGTAPPNALLIGCGYTNYRVGLGGFQGAAIQCDQNGQVKNSESGSADPLVGITPQPSSGAVTSFSPKNTLNGVTAAGTAGGPGNLYSVYSTANTAPAGPQFLCALNATSAPTSGTAIAPLDCDSFNGTTVGAKAMINFGAGPPNNYATGITFVITTSETTYTPGTAEPIFARVR